MSSENEFERLLGEARGTLPSPHEDATEQAREVALAAGRRRRPRRMRVAALLGAVVLAAALALGISALVAPSGTASRGPIGLGFLPEPGWYAFQTGGENGDTYQTVAVASNVPLDREDQVAGAADPSGLPYATLLELPSDGIVIVATFARPSLTPFGVPVVHDLELPLGIGDAAPYIQYGTQLRPEQPLGQYEISGTFRSHVVSVHLYFGTPEPSAALLAQANRQLNGIVIRRTSKREAPARKPASAVATAAPGVVDRTVVCVPALIGGIRLVDALARAGSGRRGSSWNSPAFAGVRTTISGSAATVIDDFLVWVTAGPPSTSATVVSTLAGFSFPMRSWGTVAVNRGLCRTTTKRIPLSRKGLSGGAVGPFDDQWDCAPGRRVVVRVRAELRSKSSLSTYRGFLRTTAPVKSANLVVATQGGKTLSYAEILESGKSRLFVAPSCFPD